MTTGSESSRYDNKVKDIYAPVFLAKIPIAVSLFVVYLLQLKGFQLQKHLFAYTCVTF